MFANSPIRATVETFRPRGDHIALALVTLFIVYGSLYPFQFHPASGNPIAALLGTAREWDRGGDLLSNILLYGPFGFLATRALPPLISAPARAGIALLAGIALSTGVELTQIYDQGRVSSMGDVYADAIGTGLGATAAAILGAGMRWPLVGEFHRHPDAALLLTAFAGYRLYPYVPVIDRHKYLHTIEDLFRNPVPDALDLVRFAVIWLFVAVVIESLYGRRRTVRLFPLGVGAVCVGRVLIVDLPLTAAEVEGAGVAFALWAGPLPRRPVVLACLFAGLIAALRLEPFRFNSDPLRSFGWVPFRSLMAGSIGVAMQAFLEKSYQYGGLIWLLRRTGLSLMEATALTSALLFVTSAAEIYLPGRSGESTDAAMALGIGVAFHLLRVPLPPAPIPARA